MNEKDKSSSAHRDAFVLGCDGSSSVHPPQKTNTPEEIANWFAEEVYSAVKADNLDRVIQLCYFVGEWGESASDDERRRFESAGDRWDEQHPYRSERIGEYFRKHRSAIPK